VEDLGACLLTLAREMTTLVIADFRMKETKPIMLSNQRLQEIILFLLMNSEELQPHTKCAMESVTERTGIV
jgi:hypothetical protein